MKKVIVLWSYFFVITYIYLNELMRKRVYDCFEECLNYIEQCFCVNVWVFWSSWLVWNWVCNLN